MGLLKQESKFRMKTGENTLLYPINSIIFIFNFRRFLMAKKPFEPNFKTPRFEQCREENNKLTAVIRPTQIQDDFKDTARADVEWQVEQLAKSLGIYLEFDRAKTGEEKDWMYMIRISIFG